MHSLLQARGLGQQNGRSHQWGVILAGGEGKRLLPLTRKINGDDRPKQFCKIIGNRTLLQDTHQRVSRVIESQRILFVLTDAHKSYFQDHVADAAPSSLLIQPGNRGTAAAILFSLMRIREMDPQAVVSFFPSDHHFSNEDAFIIHLKIAAAAAEGHPERVILLGIVPDKPEPGYGWIEMGGPLSDLSTDSAFRVGRFWEKPSQAHAITLMEDGCLWNTFVMVGRVDAFLQLVRRASPELFECFESQRKSFYTARERSALNSIYSALSPVSFSDEVLSASASDLGVIRGAGLGWSDLGEPKRVAAVLRGEETARANPRIRTSANSFPAVSVMEELPDFDANRLLVIG